MRTGCRELRLVERGVWRSRVALRVVYLLPVPILHLLHLTWHSIRRVPKRRRGMREAPDSCNEGDTYTFADGPACAFPPLWALCTVCAILSSKFLR